MNRVCVTCLGAMLALFGVAYGQQPGVPSVPSELPGLSERPDQTPTTQPLLGSVFASQASGITFRPPTGMVSQPAGDAIADFIDKTKKTRLTIQHTSFANAIKLSLPPTTNPTGEKGLLELTSQQLTQRMPNSKVLRQDVLPLAAHDAGMLMLRATNGLEHQLMQIALIQANEQSYYKLTYTGPGEAFDAPPDKPSEPELDAVSTFRAVCDTVKLIDLAKLKDDQDDRLYRTRTLLVNWNQAKMLSILVNEQWLRVIRDGKDVGYSYVVEEPEMKGANPGVRIGIRSRSIQAAGAQIDGETWYHVSFDHKIENWSSIWLFNGGKDKYHATEFGTSQQRRKAIPDRDSLEGHIKGDKTDDNVGVKLVDVYSLSVHRVTKRVTAPDVERDLPPFYLPQGLGHLLPRLLPTNEARGYLFASYVSGEAEVKLRYVDVGPLSETRLDGKKITAYPITDRFGPDGVPTIHYMDPNGQYLGSQSTLISEEGKKSTILVLPSDKKTIEGIWDNATLTRPDENPIVPRD